MINLEQIKPNLILEWIKGDKSGDTEIVKNIEKNGDFNWVNFYSKNRINAAVISEFMSIIGIAEDGDIEKHNNQTKSLESLVTIPVPTVAPTLEKINTFGFDILDKAKRDSIVSLNIQLNFEFISKDKINMLLDLYGKDLQDSLNNYLRKQLSEEIIEQCLTQFISDNYNTTEETEQVNNSIEKIKALDKIAQQRGQKLSQMAIAWLLQRPQVTSVLIGASSSKQLKENVVAVDNLEFSNDEIEMINKIIS